MNSLSCPNCDHEMKLNTYAKAPSPWHLKCGHCSQKLRFDKYRVIAAVIGGCAGILISMVSLYIYRQTENELVTAASLLFGIILLEYASYFVFRKMGVGLEKR